ncbi:MAG: thymidylate kinase [Candidatus Omnitrophica bacterium CG11_big_fil_rev_8_21_14_0_20_63_9]|nr:MAG: thymidylate kinase [Candidatus Omnitrophica bacterium CG11_big_fil_rev_8_21_14_0_20_63_9]
MAKPKFFGEGIPYLEPGSLNLKGKLIVIEGTDGVGRTTQVERLRNWLEVQGHGVVETGWTRSELMSSLIDLAKEGNTLTRETFGLLYATDFADRLENQVIPALRSGFIVISDRYVYTAFARYTVRGGSREWIRGVFGFALIPDIVLYLHTDMDSLVKRVIGARGGMDYWESGMDMHLGNDLYDSFCVYQQRMIDEYEHMAKEFKFEAIETSGRTIEQIHDDLRERIEPVVRRPRKVDVSLLDPKALDLKRAGN